MNERTHFVKIYLSHFIFERVDVSCVWEMSGKRGQTVILTPSFSGHSITSFSSWLGCSTVGPSISRWLSRWHLVPNWAKPSVPWLLFYVHLFPLFFRLFTQVHLLIDSSVEGQYMTSWWTFTGIGVTARFLKFPGIFSVLKPISIIL